MHLDTLGKYIIVPKDDIEGLEDATNSLSKRNGNYTDTTASDSNVRDEQVNFIA